MKLIDDITFFLEGKGFECSRMLQDGLEVICTRIHDGKHRRIVIPLEISAESPEMAHTFSEAACSCIESIRKEEGYPIIITEDRWNSRKSMTQARLLAHLEVFSQAFARNCEIRRIEKKEAQEFLQANHSYGDAACRYRYGMFLKRQTGHLAEGFPVTPGMTEDKPGMTEVKTGMTEDKPGMTEVKTGMTEIGPGTLVAVATFSNARKWVKGDKEIRSYEWTRFASLPGLRISGGMGKMLKVFINEVRPDDIMSYADLEWSEGSVYKALGFRLEGSKEPVMFVVDPDRWERFPVKPGMTEDKPGMTEVKPGMTEDKPGMTEVKPGMTEVKPGMRDVIAGLTGNLYFRNFGSNKYRLKLTDYE